MSKFKGIVYWITYIVMSIIKLPFTLISALAQAVEVIYWKILARLTKWYDNDYANDVMIPVYVANANSYEYISDMILEMMDLD